MKKEMPFVLAMIALAGVILFWDHVWAYFSAMTPMEGLQTIAAFCVKWTVIGVCVWAATTLPEVVKPWMKIWKKQARWRAGPGANWRRQGTQTRSSAPRLTNDQKFMMMMSRMNQGGGRSRPIQPQMLDEQDDDLHLDF